MRSDHRRRDAATYKRLKEEIEAQRRGAQEKLKQAPPDVRTLDDLLSKVDRIAEILREGTPSQKKALLNSLFERIEVRDRELTLLRVREWARPMFNGESAENIDTAAES